MAISERLLTFVPIQLAADAMPPPPAATVASPLRGDTPAAREQYSLAMAYLRAFVTLLVVAHHAVLAYHPFASQARGSLVAEPRWWLAFPVVDTRRWEGFAWLVGFNDVFFMSLLFFVSGLFLWSSLARKGAAPFLRDRALRLGVPFLAAAAVLAPLAYYPAYLTRSASPTPADFWRQWTSLGIWPAGPAWFLWLLLAYGAAAAALFAVWPSWGRALGAWVSSRRDRPTVLFWHIVVCSALSYLPMALAFGPLHWTALGPFTFQTSRVLHYAVYFGAGIAVGAGAADRGLLAPDGRLARRWIRWLLAAIVCFAVATAAALAAVQSPGGSSFWEAMASAGFVLSCAASCFALLAIFLRWTRARVPMFDSLGRHAYGIYLVHYVFVIWAQYALLAAPLGPVAKGALVFAAAASFSGGTVAVLRRIGAIARVV